MMVILIGAFVLVLFGVSATIVSGMVDGDD